MKWTLLFIVLAVTQKCNQPSSEQMQNMTKSFDVQGHRGCRGLMPENSIPAFLKALEIGVTTLEMDVVISGDGEVIVSHEPFFSHEIALDPLGRDISKEDELTHNIYQMNVSDIQQYDCGSKPQSRFPDQIKMKTYKPTLKEVFQHVEVGFPPIILRGSSTILRSKRIPDYYGLFHPAAEEFCDRVMSVIVASKLNERVTIQSFDPEVLEVIHLKYPSIRLAFLVEQGEYESNRAILTFTPDIYSPEFSMVNKDLVDQVHMDQMKILPWTVNSEKDIQSMVKIGVDGLISDYPDRVLSLVTQGAVK
ncbi:MAG: glycerophosphodiester phosphodiesterase [Saprospiraceae bacterium]|nr:glycerophosphodiester phosphodiesterase [Saprospiraceae bacterium]